MIPATIGRVVLLHGHKHLNNEHVATIDRRKPMPALISYVWSDRMINVGFFDHAGHHHAVTSVTLLQDDDPKPDNQPFATWMDYQVGQAAKYEKGGGAFEELTARVAELELNVKGLTTPPQAPPPQPGYELGTKANVPSPKVYDREPAQDFGGGSADVTEMPYIGAAAARPVTASISD